MSTPAATPSTKIALITGANKGLGLETARQLGKKSVTVLVAARDEAKGLAAVEGLRKEGIAAKFVKLEVTNAASIAAAVTQVEREFGRLDILVNNAGVIDYAKDGPGSAVPIDTLRSTFETNFFGAIAVTQAFLPLLKKSPAGRIVNLSSVLGSVAEHADPNSLIYKVKVLAYDSSKAALNMFTNHLALELKDTAIKVNAAHPGWVKTDMGGPDAHLEITDGAKTGVELALLPDTGPTGGFYHLGVHMRW